MVWGGGVTLEVPRFFWFDRFIRVAAAGRQWRETARVCLRGQSPLDESYGISLSKSKQMTGLEHAQQSLG